MALPGCGETQPSGVTHGRMAGRATVPAAAVLMQSILTPTLSPEMIRKMGSEAIAAARGVPERCEGSQSSADYVARGVRGDPRGRKFGMDAGTTNLRWPARAEGEKRFRSATRNP